MSAALQPLYTIAADRAALLDQIIENGGVITDEQSAQLDAIGSDLEAKMAACATYVRNLTAEAAKHRTEGQRQLDRAAALENTATSFKRYMLANMQVAKVQKLAGIARIQQNPQPSISWTGTQEALEKLDESWLRVRVELNAKAVQETLAANMLAEDGEPKQPIPEGIKIEYGSHIRLA